MSRRLATHANHSIPLKLPFGRASTVKWTLGQPSRLVVFVHGFRGSGRATWGRLPELICDNAAFADSDLLFFDYATVGRQIQFHAQELLGALRLLTMDQQQALAGTGVAALGRIRTRAPAGYSSVHFVAHSMGAIVVRRALLDAAREPADQWARNAQLVLFAPAHSGARVEVLVEQTLALIPGLHGLVRPFYPCLDEMVPDSPTLSLLLDDSMRLMGSDARHLSCLVARAVYIAEIEVVVYTTAFMSDPAGAPIRGSNHRTVCKEGASSTSVIAEVARCM